jgi:hypothetical protein
MGVAAINRHPARKSCEACDAVYASANRAADLNPSKLWYYIFSCIVLAQARCFAASAFKHA